MFQTKRWKRLSPLLFFFVAYSILFVLWVKTFLYTLPFLLGFLLALALQPVISFFQKRLPWSRGTASLLATILALVGIGSLLVILGILATREITSFLERISENDFAAFSEPVTKVLQEIKRLGSQLDLTFFNQHREELMQALQNSLDLVVGFLGTLLQVLTSVPTIFTLLLVTVCAAFFLARDMNSLLSWGKDFFTETVAFHVKTAVKHSEGTGRKYLFSYLFLYFLTFCETCVILSVLGLPYPFLTGILTAVADVLPVFGPGFVLIPLMIYQILIGQYAKALGLLIGWLVITCIRQIVEPKLVSSTIRLHPLVPLAAIYFSLVGKSIWILFYVLGLCTIYTAFRETGAFPPLVEKSSTEPQPPSKTPETAESSK